MSKAREFILPPDLSLPPSACGDPFEELLFHCTHPVGEPKERAHRTKALLLFIAQLTLPWQNIPNTEIRPVTCHDSLLQY